MNDEQINVFCDRIRQTAYDIHVYLAHGHLEKVYENAWLNDYERPDWS